MKFFYDKAPENKDLKEWFSWRYTAVTDAQQQKLGQKLVDEIVMRGKFLTALSMDHPPVKMEDGTVGFASDTRISSYTLKAENDEKYLALFTDRKEYDLWDVSKSPGATAVVVDFDDAVRLMNTFDLAGIVINAFSDDFAQPAENIRQWAELKARTLEKAQQEEEKNDD